MSERATPVAQPAEDRREAVAELLRQVSGIVAGTAKARWGEVQLLVEQAAAAPSWASAGTFWLQIGDEGPDSMALEFGLSAALVAELRAEKAAVKVDAVEEAAKSSSPATSSDTSADPAPGTGSPDRLMDVQLAMTVGCG